METHKEDPLEAHIGEEVISEVDGDKEAEIPQYLLVDAIIVTKWVTPSVDVQREPQVHMLEKEEHI